MGVRDYYREVGWCIESLMKDFNFFFVRRDELGIKGDELYVPRPACELSAILDRELEVYLPIIGRDCVLGSLDFEIFLRDQRELYSNQDRHRQMFLENVVPVAQFLASELSRHSITYCLDLTPSGGHFLFLVGRGTDSWLSLRSIGFLEKGAEEIYSTIDSRDIRLQNDHTEEGLVYSGLGRIWEYLGNIVIKAVKLKSMPIIFSDPFDCLNLDITGYSDPADYRSMRSPCSVHKKRGRYFSNSPAMFDIVQATCIEGIQAEATDYTRLLECMWDERLAAQHHQNFFPIIPQVGDGLAELVQEYKQSELFSLHQECDRGKHLPVGEAVKKLRSGQVCGAMQQILDAPNPRAKEPRFLLNAVRELTGEGWSPANIADILRDIYSNPCYNWSDPWEKYPPDMRAAFWARIYSSLIRL